MLSKVKETFRVMWKISNTDEVIQSDIDIQSHVKASTTGVIQSDMKIQSHVDNI